VTTLRYADDFAGRLLADARDGLAYRARPHSCPLDRPVLDIGAHYGAFTLSALEAGAPLVVAVEAALANYTLLIQNVLSSQEPLRVVPLYAAAYETTARTIALRRAAQGNSGQHSVMFHEGHPVSDPAVPVLRMSWLLRLAPLWSYVKIDIEGGEWSWLNDPAVVETLLVRSEFIDLEIHPLDAREYYPADPLRYDYVDSVGERFRRDGAQVTWTAQHPTRLFIRPGGV
jgi:FkbM family methyltransferase